MQSGLGRYGIEQIAEADLLAVMFFAEVRFDSKKKGLIKAKNHASWRRQLSSTVPYTKYSFA